MQGSGSLIPILLPILEQNMGAIATALTILGALYGYARTFSEEIKEVKVEFSQELKDVKVGFSAMVEKLNTIIIMGAVVFTAYAVTSVQALLMASRS